MLSPPPKLARMGPPDKPPVGLVVSRAARTLGRAFERVMADAGGSQPVWLILLGLRIRPDSTQRQLAEAMGIREATMTHHLSAMEQTGLVTRRRDPENRRVHRIAATPAGDALFLRLRDVAAAFDRRLRAGIPERQLDEFTETLGWLVANAEASPAQADPEPAAEAN